jgi:hypothetical protein
MRLHIDQFLIGHARPLGRSDTRQVACSVRMFMRYLAFLGQVPAERPAQVPTPRIYRLAGLPRGLRPDDCVARFATSGAATLAAAASTRC